MKESKPLLNCSIYGFWSGILLSSAYVLFGRWGWFYTPEPLWAQITFFPGVAAGHLLYNAGCHSILACQVVGVGTMGIVAVLFDSGGVFLLEMLTGRESDQDRLGDDGPAP